MKNNIFLETARLKFLGNLCKQYLAELGPVFIGEITKLGDGCEIGYGFSVFAKTSHRYLMAW